MNKIKYIFIDFNGTLIDDVDLCLSLLNELLDTQGKPNVNMDRYKHIFTFPIIEYYRKAGLDFSIESYESMADRFIDKYTRKSLNCKLYNNVIETLSYLKNKNIKLICLSATEINMLKMLLNRYKISDYFDEILGINDIYAKSKEDIAIDYINSSRIDKSSAILIGDTLHDYECASKMGIEAILTYSGHQAIDVLESAKTTIIKDISVLKEIL